jgi:protoporphyrinogen oxidase
MNRKIAIIIGAGPAGLTAAYELLQKSDIKPIVFEQSSDIGGISKTVTYKGNRIDIGGHRFFSKSDRVMAWWQNILPLQGRPSADDIILGRDVILSSKDGAPDPGDRDLVLLVRNRLSRIYFLRSFFEYPISFTWPAFKKLGIVRAVKIGLSYLKARLRPIRRERSLEDFFINRFGRQLYLIFFKDYTEKVWGVPCTSIKPEWGAQRIKGLSVSRAVLHALKSIVGRDTSLGQHNTETSLIDQFTYPKLGPGQLWEEVARQIKEKGAELHLKSAVVGVQTSEGMVTGISVKDGVTGLITEHKCDFLISTMPVRELIQAMHPEPPAGVRAVANGLQYRDFITVGVLLKKMKIRNETRIPTVNNIVPDNWIYIQERDVKLGRLQIFNNWSPYLVQNPDTVWVGLEYFCTEGDEFWNKTDREIAEFAIAELARIDIIEKDDVLDSTVIRMQKAYPAYFGAYDDFSVIRNFTDRIENLFLIGRNGMHKYNNADHSMLTAMAAVENIVKGDPTKDNIWLVNTEEEYLEKKQAAFPGTGRGAAGTRNKN